MTMAANQGERLVALAKRFAQLDLAARRELLGKLAANGIDFALFPIPAGACADDCAPASYAQRRLWFLWQLEPESGAYNVAASLQLTGTLNAAALQSTFDDLRERHAALRTVFRAEGDAVLQVIQPCAPLPIQCDDLRELDAAARAERARALAAEEARAPFDLARGPLLRLRLLQHTDTEWELLVTMHHIVADGWSMDIVVRELTTLYAARCENRAAPLSSLPVSYADYAQWQRNWLEAGEGERQLIYWKAQLGSEHPPLELPADRVRPAAQSFRGAAFEFDLGSIAPLAQFAQTQQATLFMLVLAVFKVLLQRYTGQADLRVGVPVANRQRSEIEGLVGFFVNTQVLRTDLRDAVDFVDVLRRVRDTALGAQAHQDMPFEQLVEALNPERSLAHNPLFQVKYNYQRWHHGAVHDVAGLCFAVRPVAQQATHFDLGLDVTEGDTVLRGRFVYATDLFERDTIARLATHLRTLLHGLVSTPRRAIDDVACMEAEEQAQLRAWSERPAPAVTVDVVEQFCIATHRCPDAVAVRAESDSLTYAALDRASNRVANYLRARGIGCEQRVGLCAGRTPALIAGWLGILKAGAVCVPLEPTFPQPRCAQIVADCEPALILSDAGAPAFFQQDNFVAGDIGISLETLDRALQHADDTDPDLSPSPQQLAYLIYTSGSTGQPKGVAISRAALANYVTGVLGELKLPAASNLALVSTVAADLGHTVLFGALCGGHTLHLVAPDRIADPDRFADYMAVQRIDALKIVPGHFAALLQAARAADVIPESVLILGGEACSWELFERVQRLKPQCRIINHYGPTETTVGVLAGTARRRVDCRTLPLGTPLPNARTLILDAHLRPVPVGVPGEIYIGGAGVGRGYWRRAGLTAERFVPDPFVAGARLYRSGDRARYRHDGVIEFLGRVDHQVKIRGYRAEPDEVAQVLRQLPSVSAAVVIARADDDGTMRLFAYYVRAGDADADADADAVRAALAQRLPDYLLPAACIELAAMPLNANGKLDRAALPLPGTAAAHATFVAPRNALEQLLVTVWSSVLKRERIGVHDNFFELGGDSILSLQIIAGARKRGLRIAPKLLFEHQTVAALALALDPAAVAPESAPSGIEIELTAEQWQRLPVSRTQVAMVYPLTPLQQGMLFHRVAHAGSGVHINQRSCTLHGAFDALAFEAAWRHALDAHPILRTIFAWDGLDEPLQVVCAELPFTLEWHNWRAQSPATRESALRAWLAADRERGFDLAHGPLMRVSVIEADETLRFVVWTVHHLLLDGWSSAQLLNDVFADYAARRGGTRHDWRARPPFRDYVHWLRAQDGARAEAFWRERLGDLEQPTLLAQHLDASEPVADGYASEIRLLGLDVSAQLRAFAQAQRVTLNTMVQGALALLLGVYTGSQDVVFGTTVSGRSAGPDGIQDMVGLLINTLPLRVRIDARRAVGDWLRDLQAQHSAVREFEYAPLAQVQACAAVARGTPLFDTLLVFQNYPVDPELAARIGAAGLDDLQSFEQTQYPLTVMVVARGPELRLRFDYDRRHYDAGTIARCADQIEHALAEFAAAPDAPLHTVALLPAAQRQLLAEAYNDTARDWPEDDLAVLFERSAAQFADAPALIAGDGWLTYAALNARANRLAHRLRAHGVGADTLVALCLERRTDLIVALLGVLKAGAAYLPLDPSHPRERLAQVLAEARPQLLLTHAVYTERLPAADLPVWQLDAPDFDEAAFAPGDPPHAAQPTQLAYCIYTSGSTGRPKGVAVTRAALRNFLFSMGDTPGLRTGERVLALTALTFDIAALEIYLPLLRGGTVVLADRALATDPRALLVFIAQHAVDVVQATPAAWRLLSEQPQFETLSLRLALCGGEALPADLADRLAHCAAQAWNLYGPTETTVWSARQQLETGAPPLLGVPLDNTVLHVLDAELKPAPVGATGELYIGGLGLARGYWRRADLTAERFVPDPFTPGARLYRTGDLARRRLDGGAIEYRGRIDHQIKIRGFRIEPGEIEAQLLGHADVAQAAVLVRAAPGGDQLVGYVVARAPCAPEPESLKRYLTARLPDVMVPAHIVVLAQFPLTASGKLDRRALPDPAWREREHVAPRTVLEEGIVAIWREVLGVERVGATDNFFELGGHSLLAARATARVRNTLLVDMPFDGLFRYPVLGELAQSLERGGTDLAADIDTMDALLALVE